VLAFIFVTEGHAQRNRALGVHRRELLGVNRVEGAEQIEFSILISCRVA
jgi:hypothetical protein